MTLGGASSDFGLLAEEEITDEATSSTRTYQYIWGADVNGSYHGLGGVGGLVAVVDKTDNNIYIPLMDAKGTVYKYIYADNGIVAAEFDYDPYGRIMQRSGSQVANLSLRYQSKYHDPETNTYYYGVRHYDPTTCRWLSRDPLEEEGGYNLYAFVNNDPINNIDYLGFRISPESSFYKWAKAQAKAGRYLDKNISAMREIYNKEMSSVGILDYIMPFHSQMLRREPMSSDVVTTLALGNELRTNAITVAGLPYAAGLVGPLAVETGPTAAYVGATNYVAITPWAMKTATGMGYLMQALTVGTFAFGDDDTRAQMMSMPGGSQAIIYSGGNLFYQGARGASAMLSTFPKINPANYRLSVKPALGCNFGNVGVKYVGARKTAALQKFYPENNGFLGMSRRKTLMPGELIDRYGGSKYSRFFSPAGTPKVARALPPGVGNQTLRTFKVLKPFEVEAGAVNPAFDKLGLGTQYKSPVTLEVLIKRGIISEL